MKLAVSAMASIVLAGCGLMPAPREVRPAAADAPRISFALPDSWARLEGSGTSVHYFTTGDPDVCANVVGACDPTTYVMAHDTMDVAITPVTDDSGCAETGRPTWDARVEERAPPIREATYRLIWSVCYPDTDEAVQIAADLRSVDPEARDALLEQLHGFVDSLVLVHGHGEVAPET